MARFETQKIKISLYVFPKKEKNQKPKTKK